MNVIVEYNAILKWKHSSLNSGGESEFSALVGHTHRLEPPKAKKIKKWLIYGTIFPFLITVLGYDVPGIFSSSFAFLCNMGRRTEHL